MLPVTGCSAPFAARHSSTAGLLSPSVRLAPRKQPFQLRPLSGHSHKTPRTTALRPVATLRKPPVQPRFVFLPDEGMAFFLKLTQGRHKDEPAFLHQDGSSWRERYKHLFRNAVIAADLPDNFVFHGLRHTYASQLVQAATPLIVVAQQLGHATADTVARTYGHMAPQIREMQVRKNFAPIELTQDYNDPDTAQRLDDLSSKQQSTDWRGYGFVPDEATWPRSNFTKNMLWGRERDDS